MIARRAMLAAMGGLPFARPDQHYEPPQGGAQIPGARGLVRAHVVIISGGPGSGIFVYSPSPGAGNLVESVAATAGTDPYGNAYLAGFASYQAPIQAALTGAALAWSGGVSNASITYASGSGGLVLTTLAPAVVSVFGGGLSSQGLITASHGLSVSGGATTDSLTWTAGATGDSLTLAKSTGSIGGLVKITEQLAAPGSAPIEITSQALGDRLIRLDVAGEAAARWLWNTGTLQAGAGTGAADVQLYRTPGALAGSGEWVASDLNWDNANASEVWNAPALQNSWANSGTGPNMAYRRVAAPEQCVQLVGSLTVPAGFVAGQTVFTVASSTYHPVSVQSVLAVNKTTGGLVRLAYNTFGTLTYQSGGNAAGNVIDIPASALIELTQ